MMLVDTHVLKEFLHTKYKDRMTMTETTLMNAINEFVNSLYDWHCIQQSDKLPSLAIYPDGYKGKYCTQNVYLLWPDGKITTGFYSHFKQSWMSLSTLREIETPIAWSYIKEISKQGTSL